MTKDRESRQRPRMNEAPGWRGGHRIVIVAEDVSEHELLGRLRTSGRMDLSVTSDWRDATEVDVVLLPVNDPNDHSWRLVVQELQELVSPPTILLCAGFGADQLWRLGPLPNCYVFFDRPASSLRAVIKRLRKPDPCQSIYRRLTRVPLPIPLAPAMRRICQWRPASPGEGEYHPSLPSIPMFAEQLRCSVSHLYGVARESGIDLGALLRGVVLIRGLQLRSTVRGNWVAVAVRLGFSSASAWSNFVRCHWSMSPSEAIRRSQREWVARVLHRVSRSHPGPHL